MSSLQDQSPPDVFINTYRRRNYIECQTLDLVKINQKISQAHSEVVDMSDEQIQLLIEEVRPLLHPLFKVSESLAMLDVLSTFAALAISRDYIKPEISPVLALKDCRHPIRERINQEKFIPNDVYAAEQSRFQIITGCNMSGKSIYIRSITLLVIMAQIGCFVPAQYASFPLSHQLFARVSSDDSIEANVSTFAAEMREIAFILHSLEPRSLVIVDELGRGTSTQDGLVLALAVAEALIQSKSLVWFVTHFRELPKILAERAGVINLHLVVDIAPDYSKLRMRYKIAEGWEKTEYYGLAIARVLNLPDGVIETATRVSEALNQAQETQQADSKTLAIARRRKLVLNVREQILQLSKASIDDATLRQRLQSLQQEFIARLGMLQDGLCQLE